MPYGDLIGKKKAHLLFSSKSSFMFNLSPGSPAVIFFQLQTPFTFLGLK